MELMDVFIVAFLEWLYEPLCVRFGKIVAATLVIVLALAIISIAVLVVLNIAR
jgi:hypothetical protein